MALDRLLLHGGETVGNPARGLLEHFQTWREPGNASAHTARGFAGATAEQAFADHEHAMRCLTDMSRTINRLEAEGHAVGHYRRGFRLWMIAFLNLPHGWQQDGLAGHVFTDHAMDMLESLAATIDRSEPHLQDTEQQGIGDYLDQVLKLLGEDTAISDELRQHIFRTVQTVRDCLEEVAILGKTDLKKALHDLWISLYAAAGQSDGEPRTKWQKFAEHIVYPTFSGLLASLPSAGIAIAQLTQGH